MKPVRSRLTYANVVSSLALFLALTGATAFAAKELAPNSVGTKQLKANSVTAEKLRSGSVASAELGDGSVVASKLAPGSVGATSLADGSVIASKLAPGSVGADKLAPGVAGDKLTPGSIGTDKLGDGSVTTSKLANGSVTADKLAAAELSQLAVRIRETRAVPWVRGEFYPLTNPSYTQPVGRTDQYVAAFQVKFSAACVGARFADVTMLIDRETVGASGSIVGDGRVEGGSGEVVRTGQIVVNSAIGDGMARLAPTAPTRHTFELRMESNLCRDAGSRDVPNGVTLVGAGIDVIGTR